MTREELIQSAKKLYDSEWPNEILKEALEETFPELKESEDEKIRKALKLVINNTEPSLTMLYGIDKVDLINWLEKQKEPTEELSIRLNGLMQEYVKAGKDEEEQEHRLKCYQLFWDALEDSEFFEQKEQKPDNDRYMEGYMRGIGEQKPAEWSEEDEDNFSAICETIKCSTTIPYINGLLTLSDNYKKELIDWLKSLRPQPHWKPSEEQMEWLKSAVKLSTDKPHIHGIIISLYEALEKL